MDGMRNNTPNLTKLSSVGSIISAFLSSVCCISPIVFALLGVGTLPSGVLAEQINPHTHEPISVSPLTWSHATFIMAVQEYINKSLEIEKCMVCNQSVNSKYFNRI